MKRIIVFILCFIPCLCFADVKIHQVSPQFCKQGEHKQPQGVFSLYIFCDDALGSNIAIFVKDMHNPVLIPHQKYDLGKRFWQGEPWAYDVISFAWLNESELLLSTSGVYGSGSLYLLDLYQKKSRVLFQDQGAIISIEKIENSEITVEIKRYKKKVIIKKIAI